MTPPWCRAAVVVIPSGITGRFSTKEDHRVLTETTNQLLPHAAPTSGAAGMALDMGRVSMKTIAARFDDSLFELLSLVATIEETSIVDQIRDAVDAHIKSKIANGDLEARAAATMAEIDEEAKARKAAISSLIGQAGGRNAKGRRTKPVSPSESPDDEPKPKNPVGFAPPSHDAQA